ncbi:MAG: SPOR domain-containing protein [Treponema sp.]|nr:SPOR domain-containing protein [Treponema sp.]
MKKIISFAVTLFTVATLFAAARPSLDGRALVADAGAMPKGLFARTIGYLPGDSVSVTNPATGSTVDVLILGAIDPGEGVAILLSPEAADKLNITKDSNVQVKITKRAGSLDETVSGAAMLSESDEPSSDEDEHAEEELEDNFEENLAESSEEDVAGLADTDSATVPQPIVIASPSPIENENPVEVIGDSHDEENEDENAIAAAEEPVPETASPTVSETPVIIEYPPEANVAEAEEPIAPTPVIIEYPSDSAVAEEPVTMKSLIEEPAPERVPENIADADSTDKSDTSDRIVFIEAPGEPATDVVPAPVPEDTSTSDAYLDELAQMIKPNDETEEPVVEAESPVVSELFTDEVPVVAEDVVVEYVEDIDLDALEPVSDEKFDVAENDIEKEPELESVEPVAENVEPVDEPVADVDDGYQPIILVPADENPPMADETVSSEEKPEQKETHAVAENVAPVETVSAQQTKEAAPVSASAAPKTKDVLIPSLKDLKSGSYYVQIASSGNTDNIDALLAKYGEKYPMVVVPLTSGKAYQILVGPLTTDEYTVVQEKFRAFGFKDAFLRKIR